MSEHELDTAQFIDAVLDEGVDVGETKYYATGEGRGTQYHVEDADSNVEDITKSDLEEVWDAAIDDAEEPTESEEVESNDEPDKVHLGTFYYSRRHWSDAHREELEAQLDALGWSITGEVDSG